jgi:sugar phosphate isomerase/epimerase
MSQTHPKPLLGIALTLPGLRQHRAWILERQRDVEVQDFVYADLLNGDWQTLAADIRQALDGYRGRLGLHGPFWGFDIGTMDPDVRTVVRKRLMQGLDVCAALGATQMVVHSPYSTWDYNNLDHNPGGRERMVERVHDAMREAVRRAEDMGCVLVLENIEDKDPHIRVDLARSFDSPAVRVSLDTGHANYAYGATGGPPVDYYVHAAGDMLAHVHLQDTDGHADRHWHPGEGNIRWNAVFRALGRIASTPRLLLEVDDVPGARRGADHLIGLGLAE